MIDPKHFKTKKVEVRFQYLHPLAKSIIQEMLEWLKLEGVDGVITETVTTPWEDGLLQRKSKTHQQGRAWDLRTRNWSKELIEKFQEKFGKKYGIFGAISPITKRPIFLLHHDSGHGDHFHCQLSGQYALALPSELEPKETKTA